MHITIIRSYRRTVGIQVNPDLSVTVRAPRKARREDIERILAEKEDWIRKSAEKIKKNQEKYAAAGAGALTREEIAELASEARRVVPARVEHFASLVAVTYGRITIRCQRTRWGSCSSKGNLNFNCLLMLAPPEVLDYVVVHELCHRRQMNHSSAFWAEVEKVLPDYRESVRWLKEEGSVLMQRVRET